MKLIARWMLAAALAVAVAGSAQAQRQQRQQPGQGGAGRGQGNAVSIALVLTNKDLQEELKVTDDQKGKLKDVTAKQEDLNKKQRELFAGGTRPDMDKMQEMQKERTALTEEVKKATDEVLTADQKKRFKQIEIQALGVRAFANADVVKELKITDDEKTALKEISDAFTKERTDLAKELGVAVPGARGGRPAAGATPPDADKVAEFAKKSKPLADAALEKSVKALSADQQKQWTEMIGTKFDTSKLTARPMRMAN